MARQKAPNARRANPEERGVHTVRRSDEGCSPTPQLGSFCDAIKPEQATGSRALVLLLILVVGFAALLYQLFASRFGIGDIYPGYSSLRTDRLGVKILGDSLEKAGYTVQRNYRPLAKLKPTPPATYFFIGLPDFSCPAPFRGKNHERLVTLLEEGNRVILTLLPADPRSDPKKEGECAEPSATDAADPAEDLSADQPPEEPDDSLSPEEAPGSGDECQSLADFFGFNLEIFPKSDDSQPPEPSSAQGRLGNSPLEVPWQSAAYFSPLAEAWHSVLSLNDQPVLVERSWGQGSLVLATDSSFLNNETLWSKRYPLLLAWLLGGNEVVIFDEAHLGLRQQVSISRLIQDFNLHWIIIALAVPALLFIRRCSSPLAPAPAAPAGTSPAGGRDHFSGMVSLLHRHPPENLLPVCLAIWLKTHPTWQARHQDKYNSIDRVAHEAIRKNIVMQYKAITRVLQPDKHPAGKTRNRKPS